MRTEEIRGEGERENERNNEIGEEKKRSSRESFLLGRFCSFSMLGVQWARSN